MDTNSTQPSSIENSNHEHLLQKQLFQNDQKRRSSSRSIKRKRFDDEIVEYSIGSIQQLSRGNTGGRIRTQSQTILPPQQLVTLSQISSIESPSSVPPIGTGISSTIITQSTPVQISNSPSAYIQPPSSISLPPTSVILPNPNSNMEKRKSLKTNKKSKKSSNRPSNQIATKDLGRWKPIDDLALIIGIQQTNDLRLVHQGTKFSCKFTLQEMQSRWHSLLYDEPISRLAVAAMRNLHPELVDSVQSKALYTAQEEELLGTIKSTDCPVLATFQELLDQNASSFYVARTAKILQNHWQLMKQYFLLPDQVVKPLYSSTDDQPLSFSDAEDCIVDAELAETRDDALEIDLALRDRRKKCEIRQLENELSRWSVLVDSLTSVGITPEFDNQTLAVLRGRMVRYLMRSKEITFGRSTKDSIVDVDLSLEQGSSMKVSRRQGTIKLRSNGDFFISNEGKRPIFIDGSPLLTGNKSRLANNCVLEISGLRFVFLVNYDLINAIRHESAKTTSPLN